jgi:16S rRNA (guanine(966)-N(2))-methyltransferase RsmD
MRIIGGTHGGRTIPETKGLPVRPTTDRTKEALFNLLMHRYQFDGLAVLDLFTGTGNLSFECRSRGASPVIAVDKNRRCLQAVERVMQQLDLPGIELVQADAHRFVAETPHTFDLILMDPPYGLPTLEQLVRAILDRPLLRPGGLLVAEHGKQQRLDHLPGFEAMRTYGSSQLSLFGRKSRE